MKGILGHDFSSVYEVLSEAANQHPLVYFPNEGNAGDALIATATYKFFRNHRIDFEIGREGCVYDGRVIVFSGGGNLTGPNSYGAKIISLYAKKANKFILLPHTVNMYGEIFSKLSSNAILFGREESTIKFLKSLNASADVRFAHDMALSLCQKDIDDLVSPILFLRKFARHRWWDYRIRELLKVFLVAYYRLGHLMSLRIDGEKTSRPISLPNIDVSMRFWPDSLNEEDAEFASRLFLMSLKISRSITTNRLHVAIGSILLRKCVKLYDNSYGKNKDVYAASLKGVDTIEFLGV